MSQRPRDGAATRFASSWAAWTDRARTGVALARRRGPLHALARAGRLGWDSLSPHFVYPFVRLRQPAQFAFEGRSHACFRHPYNATWRNERAVEIPVVRELVLAARGRRVLEVGHVLGHYFRVDHDVVDKFERAPGVQNVDIVDWRPTARYDLIVSVSTLEHVGWDEEPRDPAKAGRAVEHLRDLLAPGGRLLATLPLGYNSWLDAALAEGSLPFSALSCLRRTGPLRWEAVPLSEALGVAYGAPFRGANAVVFASLTREPAP